MQQHVAFLRGINVGGRVMKMDDLQACFEDIGFANVKTVLQTGNVVFESQPLDIKPTIERCLTNKFHYPAKVQIISLDNLKTIVKKYPFETSDSTKQNYV